MLAGTAAAASLPRVAIGQGRDKIRIGVPTRTYWPTIVCETAIRQKLFEKAGIDAELTIYRSGAEGFEAIAAGAADLILNSSSSVAAGLKKGVNVKCVANGANGYYGWYLVVKPDSKVTKVEDLAGKKVGITSAGSGSDILALWTVSARKVTFTRVPLGGGGLVPNLMSGNIDATVLYSPLTYRVMQAKEARQILDYGEEVPAHSTASWIATEKIIKDRPAALQKALNGIYGGLDFLCADKNRDAIAAAELDGNIKKLSRDGLFQKDWMERALEMARMIGMTDLAPVDQMYVETFKPVPTKA
jgi:NitT/TauT family transport system substrate-binding protein